MVRKSIKWAAITVCFVAIGFIAFVLYDTRYFFFFGAYNYTADMRADIDLSRVGLAYSGEITHAQPVKFKYGIILHGIGKSEFHDKYEQVFKEDKTPVTLKLQIDFYDISGHSVHTVNNKDNYWTAYVPRTRITDNEYYKEAIAFGFYYADDIRLNEKLICNVTVMNTDKELSRYGPFTFYIVPAPLQ